jgi:hypothetical protein
MDEIKKALHACVGEFYLLEKGAIIQDPNADIRIGDCRITRRQIKHVVEQRKAENKSLEEVAQVINLIPEVILKPDFEAQNYSQKYPGSVIRAKTFTTLDQAMVVVLDEKHKKFRDLITAHLYSPDKMDLLKKKLNITAAGKTPHL